LIVASADRIIELLYQARARPAGAERERFLAEACGDDATLKDQIVSLLKADADEGDSDFLKNTQLLRPTAPVTEKPGDRIGRYRLLEQIGEGGCGVVYMAEQEEPVRRRVALKVIKLGMDTKQVIARFEAERQALAMMDHPNIAKVLDAGATDTGRPFFVMELVCGIKITDYCDQNNLSTDERLKLFIQVCQAIQHAHQKGIIHRDIKPSNILVTQHDDVAVPKVIDFGIAKATIGQLTDKTVFTAFTQFVGTPAYMSPEQAQMSGLDIDTRADIYSLGVLLYELLTGNTPFDAKELLAAGMDEMRRKIREDEPARPSTRLSTMAAMDLTAVAKNRHVEPPRLIHLIRGDLDWLVMRCLEKDRTRRYATANALAMDLQRHLNDEPVVACPPSRSYRFQKLVRRNKLAFAAATAITIVLVLGAVMSTWQAIRATRAERDQSRLRAAAQQAQVNEARSRLNAEADEKKAEIEAARNAQVAHFMKDMLKGVGPGFALGRDTKLLQEILGQTRQRLDELKGQPEVEADLCATLGNVYSDIGEYTNAAAMLQEALTLRKKLHGGNHPETANSLNDLAELLYRQGKWQGAEAMHRAALAMRQQLFGSEHLDIAASLSNLGEALRRQGKLSAAEPLHREALAIRKKLLGDENLDVAQSLYNLGLLLWRQGNLSEAESSHREALAIRRKLLGDQHPDVATSLDRLGLVLGSQKKTVEAEKVHREELAMRRKLLDAEHPDLANTLYNLSLVLTDQGKLNEAAALQQEALAIRRKRLPPGHPEVFQSVETLANVLGRQGKLDQEENLYRDELNRQRRLLGDLDPAVAKTFGGLAGMLEALHKDTEAEALYRERWQYLCAKLPLDDPRLDSVRQGLGGVLLSEGKWAEVELLFNQPAATTKGGPPLTAALLRSRGVFRARTAHWKDAAADFSSAITLEPDNPDSYHPLGPLLVQQGDLSRYRSYRTDCLARFGLTADPVVAERIAKSCLLLPATEPELGTLSSMADTAVSAGSNNWRWANFQFAKGLAEHRMGRFDSAAVFVKTVLAKGNYVWMQAEAEFVLALASHQTRHAGEARAALETGTELLEQWLSKLDRPDLGGDWKDLLIELILMREARDLIGGQAGQEAIALLNDDQEDFAVRLKLYQSKSPYRLAERITALLSQGKFAEAEPLARECLALWKQRFGAVHRKVGAALGSLARVLRQEGKLTEAEALLREELAMERKLSGDEHPFVANSLAELTSILLAEKQFAEAEPTARECLTIREQKLPDEWRTFNARSLLGESLLGQKKFAEAEPLLVSAYEGMKQREGRIPALGKPRLRESLQRLVQLYEAMGQSEKAAGWKTKLADFDQVEAVKQAAVPQP